MSTDEILSTIGSHPTASLVYSSFGFYARGRGGELPGLWLVHALQELDVAEPAVRQTLYRMEASEELRARKQGRHKLYRPSRYSWASIDAGDDRLTHASEAEWDGEWTVVYMRFSQRQRLKREQIRRVLQSEGFASLLPGVYIHPRARAARLLESLPQDDLAENVIVTRGRMQLSDAMGFAQQLWDLGGTANGYRSFLARFGGLPREDLEQRVSGLAGFALKYLVALEYLDVAWRDPELPLDLLPPDWPGADARRLACELNDRLLPVAVSFGDDLMEHVLRESPELEAAMVA